MSAIQLKLLHILCNSVKGSFHMSHICNEYTHSSSSSSSWSLCNHFFSTHGLRFGSSPEWYIWVWKQFCAHHCDRMVVFLYRVVSSCVRSLYTSIPDDVQAKSTYISNIHSWSVPYVLRHYNCAKVFYIYGVFYLRAHLIKRNTHWIGHYTTWVRCCWPNDYY